MYICIYAICKICYSLSVLNSNILNLLLKAMFHDMLYESKVYTFFVNFKLVPARRHYCKEIIFLMKLIFIYKLQQCIRFN